MTSPPGPFNVDDEVTYTCNDQYILEGNAILTCQSTGQFAPAIPPTCVRGDQQLVVLNLFEAFVGVYCRK